MMINGVTVVKPDNFDCYVRWLGRNITEGRELARYVCPHCATVLHAEIPAVGDASDSLSNCPVCDRLFFKIVDNETGEPVVTTHLNPTIL